MFGEDWLKLVVNNADEPRLYRNESSRRNGWLRLRVEGAQTNRDGAALNMDASNT